VKPPSPLLGFNNNVRHKGRVFHIQTEDSGVRHPHIITHLFADGGRILKTQKTSYAEFIDAANMGEVVRQMMQEQHKAMFMALRDGQFDHLVEELPARGGVRAAPSTTGMPANSGATAASAAPKSPKEPALGPPPLPIVNPLGSAPTMPSVPAVSPAMQARMIPVTQEAAPPIAVHVPVAPVVVPPPPPPVAATMPSGPTPTASAPIAPPPLPAVPAVSSFPSVPPAPHAVRAPVATAPHAAPNLHAPAAPAVHIARPTPTRVASARPRLDIDPAAIHRAPEPNFPALSGTLASVVEASVEAAPGIDLDTLERAAAEAETPLFQQIRDLPPPPAAVVGSGSRPPAASPGGYSSVSAPAPASTGPPSTRGRYAPSRPSSIFASVRPQEGASIFGEDLISEKSLDEVILSYLAEDLDGPGEKK
jgi:hypothetical protein